MIFDQSNYDIRCEWGRQGLENLAPGSDAVIIVDILSFTTAVSLAVKRGALIFPYGARDEDLPDYARSVSATVAGHRSAGGFSLSPASLLSIPSGTRLVLPSLNGGTLCRLTGHQPTLAGCLRNARAVAEKARQNGKRIAVIPSGERWAADGSLRPAIEDWLGAGAIINYLSGSLSPEAALARAAFNGFSGDLTTGLNDCASGRELRAHGYAEDIRLAAEINTDEGAPVMVEGAFRPAS
jgi:2-phosphosulfolactate phosphatase